jgi:hypothetical protein
MVRRDGFRYVLGAALAFVALNAFAGGIYGMLGARGVPRAWLQGSPFSSYFVPGLVLFVVVGGAFTVAALAVLGRRPVGLELAALAASILLVWLAVQVATIGLVSWLQPATGVAALGILVIVYQHERRFPALQA